MSNPDNPAHQGRPDLPVVTSCPAPGTGRLASIRPDDWEALDHDDNPFLSLQLLRALEESGSVRPQTGWEPCHLAIHEDGRLVAFAPTWLKSHSHGEFVFDWAWADAYARYGRVYYPKLLTAVPYTPVTGPRLLVRRGHPEAAELRRRLVEQAFAAAEDLDLSTWHCNFFAAADHPALEREPLIQRHDWQFHWHNRDYASFDDFLAGLRSKKRKNILRERRQIREAGIRFERRNGGELDRAERDFVFACYQKTFHEHGNHPALTADFFERLYDRVPEAVRVVLAFEGDEPIAMAWFLEGGGRLYGRYWGCTRFHAGLHFETAYYQGIEHCIEHGLEVFEPGAQGEHKLARGFEATRVRSAHLVRDPVFRAAIADHVARENEWLDRYRDRLNTRRPYRREITL